MDGGRPQTNPWKWVSIVLIVAIIGTVAVLVAYRAGRNDASQLQVAATSSPATPPTTAVATTVAPTTTTPTLTTTDAPLTLPPSPSTTERLPSYDDMAIDIAEFSALHNTIASDLSPRLLNGLTATVLSEAGAYMCAAVHAANGDPQRAKILEQVRVHNASPTLANDMVQQVLLMEVLAASYMCRDWFNT